MIDELQVLENLRQSAIMFRDKGISTQTYNFAMSNYKKLAVIRKNKQPKWIKKYSNFIHNNYKQGPSEDFDRTVSLYSFRFKFYIDKRVNAYKEYLQKW